LDRSSPRTGLERSAAVALVVAALGAALAPAARAGWSSPFRLAPPATLDLLPSRIGFSSDGAAAVSFAVHDADNPSVSTAYVTLRSPAGRLSGPRRVAGAQEVLDLAWTPPPARRPAGTALELLTGTSPAGLSCCSSARLVRTRPGGGFGAPRTLIDGLTGATVARLLTLSDGRMLAAIATDRGVWVSQAAGGDRFGAVHRLTAPGDRPESLAAISLPNDQSAVAWTARSRSAGGSPPSRIFVAVGSRMRGPSRGRAAVTVPGGHQIDELELAGSGSTPTVAWIESWNDRGGGAHSQPIAADLTKRVRPHVFSAFGELASRIALAADARGDQAIAWEACAGSGTCAVMAAVRFAGERFGRAVRVGSIDASEQPAVAVGPSGEALVGWIDRGQVIVADRRPGARTFGAGRVVSRTDLAADLTLAFGPGGEALAAWTRGTLAPAVVGAVYRAR
jgi:hypothetical protein